MSKHPKAAKVEEFAEQHETEIVLLEGLDDAITGIVRQFDHYLVVYDRDVCIRQLMVDDMTHDEAVSFFEENTSGGYIGEKTPVFTEIAIE